jgi:hypothetical protein
VQVVVQTAAVWPYTMQDSAGEAAASAASGGLRIPLVMVRAADGAKLQALCRAPARAPPTPPAQAPCEAAAAAAVVVVAGLRARPLDASCPVCQEPYRTVGPPGSAPPPPTVAVKLPCRHLFHEACALAWLAKRHTCPVCRAELPTDDGGYEATRFERQRDQTRDQTFQTWFS